MGLNSGAYWILAGLVEAISLQVYTGDNTNNRLIDLGDEYDLVIVVLSSPGGAGVDHFQFAYSMPTDFAGVLLGALWNKGTGDQAQCAAGISANNYFQGIQSGADRTKIKLGALGTTNWGSNFLAWDYIVIAFKFGPVTL